VIEQLLGERNPFLNPSLKRTRDAKADYSDQKENSDRQIRFARTQVSSRG
jgi:hypothetical protein